MKIFTSFGSLIFGKKDNPGAEQAIINFKSVENIQRS